MRPVPILVNEPLARKRWAGGEIDITCEKWSASVDGVAFRSAGILRQIVNEILNFHPARENKFATPSRKFVQVARILPAVRERFRNFPVPSQEDFDRLKSL